MLRKVANATEDTDLFGSGLHGFTSGDATVPDPATTVSHLEINHWQEELARCVEGSGQTIATFATEVLAQTAQDDGDMIYDQLDQAVRDMARCVVPTGDDEAVGILSGFRIDSSGASLDITINGGDILDAGRVYVITDAKLAAASVDSITLTASMDSYLHIAHQNPADSDANERTVYIVVSEVAVGASQPSEPAGTFRFARCTTDGSGVTEVVYFNDGPALLNEDGAGVRMRRSLDGGTDGALVPMGNAYSNVDLGAEINNEDADSPETGRYFRAVYAREYYLRGFYQSGNHYARSYQLTFSGTTTGSGDTDTVQMFDADDFTDGTILKLRWHVTAHDTDSRARSYAAYGETMIRKSGGDWLAEGDLAGPPTSEYGSIAVADNANVAITLSDSGGGNDDEANIVFRGCDTASSAMSWHARVEVDQAGPVTDNPS